MNYQAAEKYALDRLRNELPENYYYHAAAHTRDVIQAVNYIGEGENIAAADFDLLRVAAVYHDLGFVEVYADHEPAGARIAGEMLPGFGYSPDQIKVIQQLIIATALPYKPKNKLEMIIRDADLDYLGREDYLLISHQLKLEWQKRGVHKSMKEWYELQYLFMSNHTYNTLTAQQNRNAGKEKHLEELKELLRLDSEAV